MEFLRCLQRGVCTPSSGDENAPRSVTGAVRSVPTLRPSRFQQLQLLGASFAVLALGACGSTSTPTAASPGATVAGTVRVTGATGSESGTTGSTRATIQPSTADVIPGEIIVRYRDGRAPATLRAMGAGAYVKRELDGNGTWLVKSALNAADTLRAARALESDPNVLYAEPNLRLRSTAQPNDTLFAQQWNLRAINAPTAWNTTTGSASTVVAVLDTGILADPNDTQRTHPDLIGKTLPGYDFISNAHTGNDGDGRDADPYDTGDNPAGQSSYHGTFVAGQIAAATNNATGVAGMDWHAKILPVRVLGVGGGTLADLIAAISWSVGDSVSGAPQNVNPAAVLNMSLSTSGPCPQSLQAALDRAAQLGAIAVVAAGNANADASASTPSSCRNVISVGATTPEGNRAGYSNHGARVDVMAPGGDVSSNPAHRILGLSRDDASGQFGYGTMIGTSMAAPHVAGLAALMKAVRPSVTVTQVLKFMQVTAAPLSASQCGRSSGADCGAGLVNAATALQVVKARVIVRAVPHVEKASADSVAPAAVVVLGAVTSSTAYEFAGLPSGTYRIEAFADLNGNDQPDSDEPITRTGKEVTVAAAQVITGVDLDLTLR